MAANAPRVGASNRETVLRVGVGDPSGLHSSIARIWLHNSNVYASFRAFAGTWKASIHYPRPGFPKTIRYTGFTLEHARSIAPSAMPIDREQRTECEWEGLEIAPGFFIEFRFRIPHSELRRFDISKELLAEVIWVAAPPEGAAIEFLILSGPASYEGPVPVPDNEAPVECLVDERLQDGRRIWVIQYVIPAPTPDAMNTYRARIAGEVVAYGYALPALGPGARAFATMPGEDGVVSIAELAADFLRPRVPLG